MSRRNQARSAQEGSAVVEVTWLTILLLVPLVYLVLSVFEVQRAAFGLTTASTAAGRAFVLSPDQDTARARAANAAAVALRDQGIDPAATGLGITCEPHPQACLQSGSVVVVSLEVGVPLPLVPAVFGAGTPSVRVSSTHRSPYGTFREARP
ncbi:MAG: hypothetical protein ACRDOJ_13365 [Nocardioidaceae bacterium]